MKLSGCRLDVKCHPLHHSHWYVCRCILELSNSWVSAADLACFSEVKRRVCRQAELTAALGDFTGADGIFWRFFG